MKIGYYQVFEYLSLIMSLIYFKSLRKHSIGLFVPLLLMICIVETLGVNYALWFGGTTNIHVYNYYLLLHPVFYLPLFYFMVGLKGAYRKIYLIVWVFVLLLAAWEFWFEPATIYHNTTNLVTMVVYFIMSFLVISRLAMDESRSEALHEHPYFWIALGIIMFCIVNVTVVGARPYFLKHPVQLFGEPIYNAMIQMVNCFFYGCYAYAFYLCYKRTKYDSKAELMLSTT